MENGISDLIEHGLDRLPTCSNVKENNSDENQIDVQLSQTSSKDKNSNMDEVSEIISNSSNMSRSIENEAMASVHDEQSCRSEERSVKSFQNKSRSKDDSISSQSSHQEEVEDMTIDNSISQDKISIAEKSENSDRIQRRSRSGDEHYSSEIRSKPPKNDSRDYSKESYIESRESETYVIDRNNSSDKPSYSRSEHSRRLYVNENLSRGRSFYDDSLKDGYKERSIYDSTHEPAQFSERSNNLPNESQDIKSEATTDVNDIESYPRETASKAGSQTPTTSKPKLPQSPNNPALKCFMFMWVSAALVVGIYFASDKICRRDCEGFNFDQCDAYCEAIAEYGIGLPATSAPSMQPSISSMPSISTQPTPSPSATASQQPSTAGPTTYPTTSSHPTTAVPTQNPSLSSSPTTYGQTQRPSIQITQSPSSLQGSTAPPTILASNTSNSPTFLPSRRQSALPSTSFSPSALPSVSTLPTINVPVLCTIPDDNDQSQLGDGICQDSLNTRECEWDKGDCFTSAEYPQCPAGNEAYKLGNRRCDYELPLNSLACGYDGGDCLQLRKKYPDCTDLSSIGDGTCNSDANNINCRYDGGDCEVVDCDVEPYASLEFCTDYNLNFPNCTVENAARIGNGACDIAGDYNTEECGYDGGDCSGVEGCTIDESLYELETSLGNGACDKIFNRTECNFDDADCL